MYRPSSVSSLLRMVVAACGLDLAACSASDLTSVTAQFQDDLQASSSAVASAQQAEPNVTVKMYHLCDKDAVEIAPIAVAYCNGQGAIWQRTISGNLVPWECNQANDPAIFRQIAGTTTTPPQGGVSDGDYKDFATLNYGCDARPQTFFAYSSNPITVAMADYLKDVVAGESRTEELLPTAAYPGLAPNSTTYITAQAIAARTYTLYQIHHLATGATINNSTDFHFYVPNLLGQMSWTQASNAIDAAVTTTTGQYLVSNEDARNRRTGFNYAIKAEYSDGPRGDQTVGDPAFAYLQSVYDPEGAGRGTIGHGRGLSQSGACRWSIGNDDTGDTTLHDDFCEWNAVDSNNVSTRPLWTNHRQVLFHYYTNVRLVGTIEVNPGLRWVLEEIADTAASDDAARDDWVAAQRVGTSQPAYHAPVTVQAGQTKTLRLHLQNVGATTWNRYTKLVYWWSSATGTSLKRSVPVDLSGVEPGVAGRGDREVTVGVVAPQPPGSYILHLDMWFVGGRSSVLFSNSGGLPYYQFDVTVESPQACVPPDEEPTTRSGPVCQAIPTDTALIIDSSGSMASNDPQGRRKEAAKAFLTLCPPGDSVGVIDFDSSARQLIGLTALSGSQDIQRVSQAIDLIDSWGGTNIGAGVGLGYNLLQTGQHQTRSAVLLTDGDGAYGDQHLAYRNAGWSIFTLGFGQANSSLLCRIARETGGDYNMGETCLAPAITSGSRAAMGARLLRLASRGDELSGDEPSLDQFTPSALTPETMVCAFQHIRSKMDGGSGVSCNGHQVIPGRELVLAADVLPAQRYWSLTASWATTSTGAVVLVSPSGRRIDAMTVAPDVAHDRGRTYEVYRIEKAEPGSWSIRLNAGVSQRVMIGTAHLGWGSTNRPPDVSQAAPTAPMLWPPNHEWHEIGVTGVTDPDGDPFSITVTSITQDEPVGGTGSGNAAPDAIPVSLEGAMLRAEREGSGNGRVYRINFVAQDARGASSHGSVDVCVPHAHHRTSCVDDGQLYEATEDLDP